MQCPNCKKKTLERVNLLGADIEYCTECYGLWFDENELRQVKDKEDEYLNWVDVDLWKDKKKFEISKTNRLCPRCRMPLYEVDYDSSKVKVDICNVCKGVWLDRGEFEGIIEYLKEKCDYEVLNHLSKNVLEELWEVFSGPEKMREEISDFITILRLFLYKFREQHPYIATVIWTFLPKP